MYFVCSVVEWGIAPPSYAKVRAGFVPQLTDDDIRYASSLTTLLLRSCQICNWCSPATLRPCVISVCDIASDRWARKIKKKEAILLAFNQVAQLDRVMYDVLDSLMDLSDLKTLPQVPAFNVLPHVLC